MTEIEEMAKVIIKQIQYDEKQLEINSEYAIDLSLKIATALDKAGYRKRSETVKEFAGKVIDGIFSHSGIAQDCSKVLASPEILQDEINDLAEQFGKEE